MQRLPHNMAFGAAYSLSLPAPCPVTADAGAGAGDSAGFADAGWAGSADTGCWEPLPKGC